MSNSIRTGKLLFDQNCRFDTQRPHSQQIVADRFERASGIENFVNDKDIAPLGIEFQRGTQLNYSGADRERMKEAVERLFDAVNLHRYLLRPAESLPEALQFWLRSSAAAVTITYAGGEVLLARPASISAANRHPTAMLANEFHWMLQINRSVRLPAQLPPAP